MQERKYGLEETAASGRRSRFLIKKGRETIALKLHEIATFYSEQKLVFLLTHGGQRFICDKNLTELEAILDPLQFFRVNRQYIVHLDSITSFRPYERVKLELKLTIDTPTPVLVSQQMAPVFKKWIYEA